jgi:hypothetical protein
MDPSTERPNELTDDQKAWLIGSERLWREADAIVANRPDLDASDVYHSLRSLSLPPAERLRRGLTRVRVRPHAR